MPSSKISIEDILDELNNNSDKSKSPPTDKKSDDNIHNHSSENSADVKRIIRNHANTMHTVDGTLRRPNPANDFKPSDLTHSKVSFVNSSAMQNIRSNPKNPVPYESPSPPKLYSDDHPPKIRRMADSTRAKEAELLNKKRNRHFKRHNATYKKETPDGEYVYSPPKVKKSKRHNSIADEATKPENQKIITDIVPSPKAVEAAKPIEPAPRAEFTSIDLSSHNKVHPDDLDIHITQVEDYKSKSKEKRTKRLVDFNYYGDVEDVGRDIFELKNTISYRVFILFLTSFLSVYMTSAAQFGIPIVSILKADGNIINYIMFQLAFALLSVITSLSVITNGIKKLFTFKADCDSMTAVCALSCIFSSAFALLTPELVESNNVHIYTSVGILSLFFNAVGKYFIIKRAANNFNFVSKDFNRHGIVFVDNESRAETLARGTVGDFPIIASMRKTDFLTDFLKYTYSSDIADSYCKRTVPLCLIFSIIVSAALTYIRSESISFAFSIFSLLICASSCMAISLVVNVPLCNSSKKFIKNQGVMLGYQSVDDFFDTNSILINADKLFPSGSIKMGGIKVFSDTKIDEALLEAASLTHYAGSIMKELFSDVIAGKEEMLYPISNFSYEDSMGLCGWINNKRVLFGNRELMTSHYIEGMPTKAKENELASDEQEAIYLSISGNLSAMFIVDIKADKSVKYWMQRLEDRNISLIVKSVDACITLKKLASLFDVSEESLKVIPNKLHNDFDEETKKAVRLSASMACSGKFTSLAQLILGTKNIYSSSVMGLIFQTVSILVGFGLCSLMILSKDYTYDYMSATSLLTYNLICTAITYFAVNAKQT